MTIEPDQADEREGMRRWLAEREAPAPDKGAFICQYCGAYAHQVWAEGVGNFDGYRGVTGWNGSFRFSECRHCHRATLWDAGTLAYPARPRGGPSPNPAMPDEIRADYVEAQTIVELSPRGACALLRLAVQKLCKAVGESGKDLNADIAKLVGRGLSVEVQQALDALRVVGNNAVHPGEFDVTDDQATALALFECINFIVDQLVAQPQRISQLYDRLPEGARDAIKKRDA